jgi:hypothetical protein
VAAGVTVSPDSAWVTQQARNIALDLNDQAATIRFLLRDHDTKFCRSFDEVFCSEGAEVLRTPIQALRANAYAERWVQTVRSECLDWMLVIGRRHLVGLLRAYVRHDNEQRPHRGLALAVPDARDQDRGSMASRPLEVRRRDVLSVSSTSTTGSQPDESEFPRPTGFWARSSARNRDLRRRSSSQRSGGWYRFRATARKKGAAPSQGPADQAARASGCW